MPSCSIKSCRNWNGNTTKKGIKFYRFPADARIAEIWIKACENEKINLKNARICSIHFAEDCFERKPNHLIVPGDTNTVRLSKTAIPTLNLHNDDSARCGRKRKVLQDCINEPLLKKSTNNSKSFTLANPVNDKENVGCAVQDNFEKQTDSIVSFTSEEPALEDQCLTELQSHEQTHNCEVTRLQEENTNLQAGNNGLKLVNNFLKTQNNDLKIQNEELENRCTALDMENKTMKKEINKLNKKLRLQQKAEQQAVKKKIYEIVTPVFTMGQIKKLLHPTQKRVKWSIADISSAIALRSVSPKGYRYLRKKNFPLPALSTLRKRASSIDMSPGILQSVLSVMKTNGEGEPTVDKLCVLSFDEVYISQKIEIDRKEEQKVGPHKTVQFGMIRGLFKRWKQPIYYDYDQPLTSEIITETIGKL
ncbi:uncharacterized protein LOC116417376 isoform X2 [Nasonia vitripennis]|uniref:THAP-type domain-containing protein n=1 Tax=Nasonia vitripennis TaxID=7425 RepID=A0A7M7QE69_NASVI|nr:uncharacterized protein LOC116417376 isoform X2 [Nasonia vitripennis]